MPKVTDFRWLFLMAIPPGSLPVFGKAPRRIFVYIAAILVYKATDTAADTEQGGKPVCPRLKVCHDRNEGQLIYLK